ncbi:MAG: hypothetical protein J4F35_12870 [Candidatus Latescibacteria bacterium]|nr:hypothetical protein [Candidatus Latescibacterota bacterium]
MNERLKDTLHQWLPKLTILSVLVLLTSFLINEYYVAPRYDAAEKEYRDKRHHRIEVYKQAREEKAVALKAALERIVGLIGTLDGNKQTQETLSKAVAQEEVIGEVWVTDAQGLIVYYGRHIPPVRNVADFPLGSLTKILNMIPEDVLSPIQRTAILLPTIIGGHWSRVSPSFSSLSVGINMIPKHLIVSTEEPISMYGGELVEMNRVKDGLIAATVSRSQYNPPLQERSEESERLSLLRNTTGIAALASFFLFWLSIPAWMTLDAQKRRERAAVWGLFGLLGNMIALIVYLLVRENGQPSENS